MDDSAFILAGEAETGMDAIVARGRGSQQGLCTRVWIIQQESKKRRTLTPTSDACFDDDTNEPEEPKGKMEGEGMDMGVLPELSEDSTEKQGTEGLTNHLLNRSDPVAMSIISLEL